MTNEDFFKFLQNILTNTIKQLDNSEEKDYAYMALNKLENIKHDLDTLATTKAAIDFLKTL